MYQLHLGYNDIQEMPWEYVEFFYNRQTQHLIDVEKARNSQENAFG